MAVNFAVKYAKAIAKRFTHASFVKPNTNNHLDFTGTKTVRIYQLTTVDETAYKRTGNNRYGDPKDIDDTVLEYTMERDVAFTGVVDKGDEKDQTIQNKAGQWLDRQIREKSTPNADKYYFRKVANFGHCEKIETEPAKNTILNLLADAQTWFDNHLVPADGRIAYIPATQFKHIVTSDQFFTLEKLGTKAVTKGQIGQLYDFQLIKIPDSYLPQNCYFLCVHKSATAMPYKISDTKIHKDPPGLSGALVEGRYYFDAFVLGEKADAVYAACAQNAFLPNVEIGGTAGAVTLTCADAKIIKYTTDGSDPRFSATAQIATSGGSLNLPENTVVRAIGLAYAQWGNQNTDEGKFPGEVVEKTISE